MNVSKTHNCYGCGVCAVACGKNLISIEFNKEGFYEPVIHNTECCTNCGVCADVCSFCHEDYALESEFIKSFGAWSNNADYRKWCSSGGVGFEIGNTIIENKGKVCVVCYNVKDNKAEHYVASSFNELLPSIGSKYIQSYTVDGFSSVVKNLRLELKAGLNPLYLVSGTPCQIDSFRRLAKKFKMENNFLFLDFFCHGVPSKLMWNKYVEYLEDKVGKLTYVSWRNKRTGWHDSWAMAINGSRKSVDATTEKYLKGEHNTQIYSRLSQDDLFYRLFLSDSCLGKQCYDNCRFKWNKSSADIRIGDAWTPVFDDNDDGVSVVVAFTEKGLALLNKSNLSKQEFPFDVVADRQMKKNASRPPFHNGIMKCLKDDSCSIEDVYRKLDFYKRLSKLKTMLRHPRYAVKVLLKRK